MRVTRTRELALVDILTMRAVARGAARTSAAPVARGLGDLHARRANGAWIVVAGNGRLTGDAVSRVARGAVAASVAEIRVVVAVDSVEARLIETTPPLRAHFAVAREALGTRAASVRTIRQVGADRSRIAWSVLARYSICARRGYSLL